MSSKWTEITLYDAVLINPTTSLKKDKTYAYVDMKSIEINRKFVQENEQRVFKSGGAKFKHNDVLMARITPCLENGKIAVYNSPEKIAFGSTEFIIFRGKNNVSHTDFIFYLISWDYVKNFAIANMSGTSGRQRVSTRAFEHLKINLPPLPEQKEIAHILGTLDDKIELNQRMNRTLEAIARAIFKSWFIDFDPVRAKMEGRQPVGMSKEIADLFPDSFVDSELGMIPKGWEVKSLPEVMEINPKRYLSKGIKAHYLDMKNMPTQGHRADFWIEREFSSGVKFINGDTLMARITPCLENGKTAFVDFLEDGKTGWGSTEYIVFRSKHPLPLEFSYYLVRSEDFKAFSILNMTGSSGRQRTPATSFNQYLIAICSEEIAIKFGESVKSLMKMISTYSNQSRTLANIRDSLLPKLISGEIRVKEAQKIVEEVL